MRWKMKNWMKSSNMKSSNKTVKCGRFESSAYRDRIPTDDPHSSGSHPDQRRKEMVKFGIVFEQEKETKNTVRFKEIGPIRKTDDPDEYEPVIGFIYIKKAAFGDAKPPKKIKVQIQGS